MTEEVWLMHSYLLLECVINYSNVFILEIHRINSSSCFSTTSYPFALFVYTDIEWHTIKYMNLHTPWKAFIIIAIISIWNQTKFSIVIMNAVTHLLDWQILWGWERRNDWSLRMTQYFMDRGATLTAQLTGFHYRRSPLVQEGLEIFCKITVTISGTVSNLLCIVKYIVADHYIEPKYKEIMGPFVQAINDAPLPIPASPKQSRKEENWQCKIQKYTRPFHPGNKARTYRKEKFSLSQIDQQCNML